MKLTKDTENYAKLLRSVGVQGRENRKQPLTPLNCAIFINRLMKEEKKSPSEISKMLGLGRPEENTSIYKKTDPTQVHKFLNLLKFSKKSRSLAGWKWESHPKVPFSVMTTLSALKKIDQDRIVQSVYNDDKKKILTQKLAKEIIKYKKENPDISIRECVKKILKLKPVKNTTYMVVCETGDILKKFISENKDYRQNLLDILTSSIEGKFYSIDATDILITLSMDVVAYRTFHKQQYRKNVSFTRFLNTILEGKIG